MWPVSRTALLLALASGVVPAHAEEGLGQLSSFLASLNEVSSIHLEADAVLRLSMDGVTRGGSGSFAYWEQGDWFRVQCETSDHLKLLGDIEWGYDGEQSRVWFKSEDLIADNTSVDQMAPTALPNPFFLPLRFLFEQEVCEGCRESLVRAIESSGDISVVTVGATSVAVRYGESDQSYLVEIVDVQGLTVPSRISWTSVASDSDVEILLSDYRKVGPLLWPMAITMLAEGRSSDMSMRTLFFITSLEVNEPYQRDQFRILGGENTKWFEPPEEPHPRY